MSISHLIAAMVLMGSLIPMSAMAQHQPEPADPSLPTLWLIGDSTVHNGSKGETGWGEVIGKLFDTSRINVVNRAIGGRSSRTFRTEGRWDLILKEAKPGDFVLMQFGHNDGGPLSGDNRERGSLRGGGDDSREVTLTLGANKGKTELVHTFGWYMRTYCTEAQDKKMIPIVCSWIPHCPQAKDGDKSAHPVASDQMSSYQLWAKEAADATKSAFIDLNSLIMKKYESLTYDDIKTRLFTSADNTHTSPAGAELNAQCVVEGIKSLDLPLKNYLKK